MNHEIGIFPKAMKYQERCEFRETLDASKRRIDKERKELARYMGYENIEPLYPEARTVEDVMRPTDLEILSYQIKELMEISPYARISQMREALK